MYKFHKSKGIFYRLIIGTAYRYSMASGQLYSLMAVGAYCMKIHAETVMAPAEIRFQLLGQIMKPFFGCVSVISGVDDGLMSNCAIVTVPYVLVETVDKRCKICSKLCLFMSIKVIDGRFVI